jgi:hypothetical protein
MHPAINMIPNEEDDNDDEQYAECSSEDEASGIMRYQE